jgi:hypothetical protein
MCVQGEAKATDFASCTTDDNCYSGYCCKLGESGCGRQGNDPGYCTHPNTSAIKSGRGYTCHTDDDCAKVAGDFLANGGYAHCIYDAVNAISNGCSFNCTPPSGNSSSVAGMGAGSGGGSASDGGKGVGGSATGSGGANTGAGGHATDAGMTGSGAGGKTSGGAGGAMGTGVGGGAGNKAGAAGTMGTGAGGMLAGGAGGAHLE